MGRRQGCARQLANVRRGIYGSLNEIARRRRGVTPSTALRLARFLDTSPGFWMNLQLTWDLFHARQVEEENLKRISGRLKSSGVVVR